jgi:hypothetical protein
MLSVPRRKFKGAIRMPNVGYRTNKRDRHVLPNGFLKVSRGPPCTWLIQLRALVTQLLKQLAHAQSTPHSPGYQGSNAGLTRYRSHLQRQQQVA